MCPSQRTHQRADIIVCLNSYLPLLKLGPNFLKVFLCVSPVPVFFGSLSLVKKTGQGQEVSHSPNGQGNQAPSDVE